MPIPQTTQPTGGDTLAITMTKILMALGGSPSAGMNANPAAKAMLQTILSAGGSSGITLGAGQPSTALIAIDPASGDVIVTATAGPNAGKSVNLTAGHWA